LAKSNADCNYLVPGFTHPDYFKTMTKIIEKERIDFVIPNHEIEINHIYENEYSEILDKCFLPKKEVVNLCIDKFKLINYLRNNGVDNVPKSQMLTQATSLDFPLWVRLIRGAGSQGAMLVQNFEELSFWVKYWEKYKGVIQQSFMISEYLPGRDHHYFSLWRDGEMVVGKAIERIRYCCSKYTLTGTSSSPSLCKAVSRPELDKLTEKIVRTVDPNANGLYGIDYKADINGVDCLTEINIGRFPRINYIFNLGSSPNIAELYVKCGLNIPFGDRNVVLPDEDLYFVRDFDTPPVMKKISQIDHYKEV
jgi:carbamoyl-phosphate synthase large subunit